MKYKYINVYIKEDQTSLNTPIENNIDFCVFGIFRNFEDAKKHAEDHPAWVRDGNLKTYELKDVSLNMDG